jgi:KDO2-lipid IV(A) lauroyltransferase
MFSFLSYAMLCSFAFFFNLLPLKSALWVGRRLAALAYWIIRGRRRVVFENLQVAFGHEKSSQELGQIARKTFTNVGMTLVEFLRMPRVNMDYYRKFIRVEGRENLDRALKEGNGVIALTFHFGNWEMAGLGAALFGYPIVAMAQRIRNPWIDRYVRRTREANGVTILPKRGVSQEVIRHLRRGSIVAIFVDQRERTKSRVLVDFFGKKAPTTPSPVVFSMRTGAPMIPLFTIRENNTHHHVVIGEPIRPEVTGENDLERNTQRYTKVLESMVRKYPDQYFWLHYRWGGKKRKSRHGVRG